MIDAIRRIADASPGSRPVAIGIGDDAALLACGPGTLVTTDTMVEGVHFRRDWLSPRALGARALRVAVSDVAAMGGRAVSVLASLILPSAYDSRDAITLMRGLVAAAAEVDAGLVGGNVSRGPVLAVTVTVLGRAGAKTPRRGDARAGDDLWVTGTLGDAAGGRNLLAEGRSSGVLIRAYREPPLRLELAGALVRLRGLGAMIDLSDGLAQDLGHVCRASHVNAVVDTRLLPLSRALRRAASDPLGPALAGGEDYELLLSARPRTESRLQALGAAHDCRITRIGTICKPRRGPLVVDQNGARVEGGYRHF